MQHRRERLHSIDAMRGLMIIIMALDHVRDFFSYTAYKATDVTQASVTLFATRWITHICAPTFVFLSGIGVYLYFRKVSDLRKTSIFLLTRGLWLIVVEIFVISFIITQGYQLTLLEVIWAIGCSMILLAALIWPPEWLQATIGIMMIAGHNALPSVGEVTGGNMIFAFLHNSPFFIANPPVLVAYTIVPWVGVMLLGYVAGVWFTFPTSKRDKYLTIAGISGIVFFIIIRALNVYGDPMPWSIQERGSVYTFLSFLNVTKSPPSLVFLCVTLGISCLLIVLMNRVSSKVQGILQTYGRVPLFFFVIHLAIISGTAYLWTKLFFGRAVNLSFTSAKDWPAEYQPSLMRAYCIWIILIAMLYLPCRWFGQWKSKSEAWWTSYL